MNLILPVPSVAGRCFSPISIPIGLEWNSSLREAVKTDVISFLCIDGKPLSSPIVSGFFDDSGFFVPGDPA